jgi:2-keto-4-pentenoate hydratase/2-oxohepta-3-ene-1,7-dioic acid hydratase in catechol pathway
VRLAAVRSADSWCIGVVSADHERVAVLDGGLGTVDDVVRGGPALLEQVRAAAAGVAEVPLDGVVLGSPLQRFNRDVLCTGWNYLDHFYESAGKREGQDPAALPEHPTFFSKGPDTVIGPTDPIAFDAALSEKWDYEAEVAIVIGKDGRSIREEDAMGYVFGYLVANDVSQRDLQRAHGGQWLKGKSIDATMPLGPWVTTAEDVADPDDLLVECVLNGEVMQHASTKEMAFSYATIIAELSRGMTLRRGDVVLTGTPSGIGNAREPAVFLRDGDELVTRVSGLGALHNRLERVALV